MTSVQTERRTMMMMMATTWITPILLLLVVVVVNQNSNMVVNCSTAMPPTSLLDIVQNTTSFVTTVQQEEDGQRYRRFIHHQHDFFNSLPQIGNGFGPHNGFDWNHDHDDDDDANRALHYGGGGGDQTEYSGPVFIQEPATVGPQSSSTYDNQSMLVTLTCRAQGYPIPKIYWRVDNMTMMNRDSPMDESLSETEAEYSVGMPQYWPHLNSMVMLRNDGQTLIIGGGGDHPVDPHQDSYSYGTAFRQTTFWNSNNPGQRSSPQQYYTISHQIECLATNRFGSIISRPIIVHQQVSTMAVNNNNDGNHYHRTTSNKYPLLMGSILRPIGPQNGKPLLPPPPPSLLLHPPHHPSSASSNDAIMYAAQEQPSSLPIHIQLYDEFVSRGNVAVLKCLVNNNNNHNFPSSPSSSLSGDSGSGASNHHQFPSYQWSSSQQQHQQPLYTFEWRIKNGPAAMAAAAASSSSLISSSIDPNLVTTIRSNQTQGKYTAFPSGELHVRDVDEHDARRTYQCAVYAPKSYPPSSTHSSSNAPTNGQQQYYAKIQSGKQHDSGDHHQNPLAESTFAQIILSGGEKDIFPPRILHRLNELDANEGQLDPVLIPCAANSQPLSTYKWYWIPFGVHFDWETEIASLLLSQQKSSSSSTSSASSSASAMNSFAIPVNGESVINSVNMDKHHQQQQQQQQHHRLLMLNRLRSFGSTLLIPGPISQSNAGHYIAIVSNTVGFDRCITMVNVRSPLKIKVDSVPFQKNPNKNNDDNYHQPAMDSSSGNKPVRVKAIRGETVRLRCIVYGFPLNDVFWLHNTNVLMVNSGRNGNKQQPQPQPSSKQAALNYHYHYGLDSSIDDDVVDPNYHGYPRTNSRGPKQQQYSTDPKIQKQQQQQQQQDHEISAVQHLDLVLDDRSKSGMYQCFARNRFETIQATIQVQVVDQAPSIVEHFDEQTVQPGETISLRCMSRGAPLAQIEWTLDRMPVPTSTRFRFGDYVIKDHSRNHRTPGMMMATNSMESLLVSHFNVTSARVEDGGLYRCTAKNVAGSTYHQARINVLGKGTVKLHTPNITALSGTDSELNCPYYGYPIKMISWFGKDGSKRKLPTNGRQNISPNGTLHISKINKKEDEGFYECEVIFQKDGPPSRTKLYLNVITGPRIDNFTFAPNLEEGMRSVVVCAVIAGDPPIRIQWLKDGQPLATTTNDRKIEMVNEFTSSITFTALKRRHAGRYTCIASNSASSDHHFADLKVNVAPVWLFEPRDILAISGQMLVINCQAEGIPDPQVRWKVEANDLMSTSSTSSMVDQKNSNGNHHQKKKKLLQPEQITTSDTNSFHAVISNPHMQILENGSLIIKEVNRDDHRRYMCSAFNGVGSGISTIIRLSVHFPPQFINGYLESKHVKLGEMIVLTCLVKVEYIEDGQKSSNRSTTTTDIVDLRWYKDITGLSSSSSSNTGGSSNQIDTTSDSDRFHVSSTFEVTEFGSVNITSTQALHHPPPSSYARYYASKLTIRHVERTDTGVYLCTAQNYYGFIRKNYTVFVLEQPDRPEEIRADEVTSTSIKLTWPMPFDGNSPINEYVISYRTISGSVSNTVTLAPYAAYTGAAVGSGPAAAATTTANPDAGKRFISFQLNDLTPATAYVVQVKAKNSIGSSQFSDSITVKTAEEPPNDVPTDVTILPLNTRSLKISWRPPFRKQHTVTGGGSKHHNSIYVPPITGYYIGYRPHSDHHHHGGGGGGDTNNNEFIFKTIKSSASSLALASATGGDPSSLETHESFVLTNLKRATRYDIKIQAFNLAGAGPSSSEYQGKTLDFDVPSAPRIRALKSNTSSIELMWSVQGEEPITGFVVSYKPATQNEMVLSVTNVDAKDSLAGAAATAAKSTTTLNDVNEWRTIKIELEPVPIMSVGDSKNLGQDDGPAAVIEDNVSDSFQTVSTFQRRTHVLGGLRCGTKYFIYVNAYNSVGQGDPSEVILTRTEGNLPVPPESVQDFVQPNITMAKINLNQWKHLGCSIELFEIDFHVYGDVSTNRKLTLKPVATVRSPTIQDGDGDEIRNQTSEQQQQPNIVELNNLLPGSWYELLVRAITEAGSIQRDYIFSTRQPDGSTIAPLTLKATLDEYGRHNNQQQRSFLGTAATTTTNTFVHSFRNNMFAQLHYIVPVSCTLVILFLVFVVVCAIQTNRNNFMFSLVATTRNRHHKVSSGKLANNSQCPMYDHHSGTDGGNGGSSNGGMLDGSQTEPSLANTNTTYCTKDHIYGTNPVGTKLTCSGSIDEILDGNNRRYNNNNNNNCIRTDSCHSLGMACDHPSSGKKVTEMTNASGGGGSKSQQQYPLYSLPVPYATSAVQFNNSGGGGGGGGGSGSSSASSTSTTTITTGNGGTVRLVMARKSDDPLYGTLNPNKNRQPSSQQQPQQQQPAQQFAGQFTEMYCDGPPAPAATATIVPEQTTGPSNVPKFPFTLTDPQMMATMVDSGKIIGGVQNWVAATGSGFAGNQQTSSNVHYHHQQQQQQQQPQPHQYELPFVFKPAPINHNESTAF